MKIGIIDSGIGGLTLLKDLINQKIQAQYFYVSDDKFVPYGEKTQDFMKTRVFSMINKLQAKNVNAIIIACNTLTAETIDLLRKKTTIPIIGIEPYVNYLHHSPSKNHDKLAMILTPATYQSKRFQSLRKKLDPYEKIDIFPLSELALIIETLKKESFLSLKNHIKKQLQPIYNKGYSHLILGCTHYPIIKDFLETHLQLKCINPNSQVAQHIQKTLNLPIGHQVDPYFLYNPDNSERWIKTQISSFHFFEKSVCS